MEKWIANDLGIEFANWKLDSSIGGWWINFFCLLFIRCLFYFFIDYVRHFVSRKLLIVRFDELICSMWFLILLTLLCLWFIGFLFYFLLILLITSYTGSYWLILTAKLFIFLFVVNKIKGVHLFTFLLIRNLWFLREIGLKQNAISLCIGWRYFIFGWGNWR